MARASYRSFVEPTMQTMAGGSAVSSRYIVYADVPGGVVELPGVVLGAGAGGHVINLPV